MSNDIRWQQRFSNFQKAFVLLEAAVNTKISSKLEQEGLIQRFEYTFELAWKTQKDFLRYAGIDVDLPRDCIKQAFANGLIKDGQVWIEMLESRNLMAHTYDETIFQKIYAKIVQQYFPAIKEGYLLLKSKSEA